MRNQDSDSPGWPRPQEGEEGKKKDSAVGEGGTPEKQGVDGGSATEESEDETETLARPGDVAQEDEENENTKVAEFE